MTSVSDDVTWKTSQSLIFFLASNQETPSIVSLKKLGSPWIPPRTISHNPAENAVLVTSPADGGIYELVNLPKDASGAVEPTDTKRGTGNSAVWVGRNRFAVPLKKCRLFIGVKVPKLDDSVPPCCN